MLIRKIIMLVTAFALFALNAISAKACTIFTAAEDGTVLVGNNEDWYYSYSNSLNIIPPSADEYGRICFYNSDYVQGGMNEFGLFFDYAYCPGAQVPVEDGLPQLGMDFGEKIISKCKTVDEAVEMLKKYNIPPSFTDHVLLADPSGASVIVEWMNSRTYFIDKKESYQVLTNFPVYNAVPGEYPCERFSTADNSLKNSSLSIEGFTEILSETKQDSGDFGTLYSNIYNLNTKEIYVFNRQEFENAYKISFTEELLNIGKTITIPLEKLDYNLKINASTSEPEPILYDTASATDIQPVSYLKQNTDRFPLKFLYFLIFAAITASIALIYKSVKKKLR